MGMWHLFFILDFDPQKSGLIMYELWFACGMGEPGASIPERTKKKFPFITYPSLLRQAHMRYGRTEYARGSRADAQN
jgi:hypothetical protein